MARGCAIPTRLHHASIIIRPWSPPAPKPDGSSPEPFPPQGQSLDKAHGRINQCTQRCRPIVVAIVGLAGAAQTRSPGLPLQIIPPPP